LLVVVEVNAEMFVGNAPICAWYASTAVSTALAAALQDVCDPARTVGFWRARRGVTRRVGLDVGRRGKHLATHGDACSRQDEDDHEQREDASHLAIGLARMEAMNAVADTPTLNTSGQRERGQSLLATTRESFQRADREPWTKASSATHRSRLSVLRP
jgi:hypothetical protein